MTPAFATPGTGQRASKASCMATWADVRRIALTLPGTTEGTTSGGKRAWLLKGGLLVWERPLRKGDIAALGDAAPEGTILGVRTGDLEMKDMLLASDPSVFFTTPHFNGYPAVLIALGKVSSRDLKQVMVDAWIARASKRAVSAYLEKARSPRR
jgi:hypothetical protein